MEASVSIFLSATSQKLSLEKFRCGKTMSLTHLVKLPSIHFNCQKDFFGEKKRTK